jgi:tetrahydromethanopterin S-methyltransferase subunit B
MLDKEKLRKADVYSGAAIFLFGLFVVSQALKMPMKDSWGGVQNVWYVSPALFPLFVGSIIMLLGALLCRTALKAIGFNAFAQTVRWLLSKALWQFLNSVANLRFYFIVVLFLSFVYLTIPRIDFFLSAVLFLLVFITAFYFDDAGLLKNFFFFYLAGVMILALYFVLGLDGPAGRTLPFAADILVLVFLISYAVYVRILIRARAALLKKFRTALIVAFLSPFVVGTIFKYFLLVPMPSEGLIVAVMDYFWYLEF